MKSLFPLVLSIINFIWSYYILERAAKPYINVLGNEVDYTSESTAMEYNFKRKAFSWIDSFIRSFDPYIKAPYTKALCIKALTFIFGCIFFPETGLIWITTDAFITLLFS